MISWLFFQSMSEAGCGQHFFNRVHPLGNYDDLWPICLDRPALPKMQSLLFPLTLVSPILSLVASSIFMSFYPIITIETSQYWIKMGSELQ